MMQKQYRVLGQVILEPRLSNVLRSLSIGFLLLTWNVLAQPNNFAQQGAVVVGNAVFPGHSVVNARDLVTPKQWQPGDPIKEVPRTLTREKGAAGAIAEARGYGFDELAKQQNEAPLTRGSTGIETITFNQDGIGFTGANPANSSADVGVSFYVQMVNASDGVNSTTDGSDVLVLSKSTGAVVANFNTLQLAAGSGTGCTAGQGSPLVLFDQTAAGGQGRWLLSELTSDSLCIYISQTIDPTGLYFIYEFNSSSGGLPDYFKLGVWPDAYYASANEIPAAPESGRANYAFDRENMILGNPARPMQVFGSPVLSGFFFELLQPVSFDGQVPPPAGAPGIFIRHNDDESHGLTCANSNLDCLELWELTIDFDNAANSVFSGPTQISISEFDSDLCGLTAFACVSQPSSSILLDPIREPIMWRPHYRNFGDTQQIVGSLVTDVDGTDRHGVRWFILERPADTVSGDWSLQQEGTFSPDASNRWMSSVALDGAGNLAVGYNVSGSETGVFPGMRYAGRLRSDPANLLPQGEFSIIEGSAANASNLYGGYSSLVVDPVDGCSFWYTAQYNNSGNWSTRAASFRFEACGEPGFTLSGDRGNQQVCSPGDLQDITINTSSIMGFSQPINLALSGAPSGTVSTFTPASVIPGNSALAEISLGAGVAAGMTDFTIDGTSAGVASRSFSVSLDVFDIPPGVPLLMIPTDMAVDVNLPLVLSWDAGVQSANFFIEIALDADFNSIIYSADEVSTSHEVEMVLGSLTTHFWRITADNPCGIGGISEVFSFTTRDIPPVLLVDDDDNSPDALAFYEATLNGLGVGFDVFDTNNTDNEPTANQLAIYGAVVWFTGAEFGGFAGPSAASEAILGDYINNTGCFFISSQDYFFDRTLTPFMTDFLGITGATNDDGDFASVTGAGSVYGGLGSLSLDYISAGLNDVSDTLFISPMAELAFDGDNDNDAASARPELRTTYLGFPLEAIANAEDREAVLQAFFDSCPFSAGMPTDAIFIDGFESGIVN